MNAGQAPVDVRSIVERFRAAHPAQTGGPAAASVGRSVGHASTAVRRLASVDVNQPNATGVKRWWAYASGNIPGVGKWLVNWYYQNLVIQVADMVVPYRGLDFSFVRTYNSLSGHDFSSSDGSSEVGQYGNGWTNTFDAHMSYNNSPAGGWSIYDVDGARYDYTYNGSGGLVPPVGMEGTTLSTIDGGSFYWTKKDGTQFTFYAPYYPPAQAAYNGRIYRISGRNRNNYIQFSYVWSPDSSTSANLSTIYATTDSGKQATLHFYDYSGQRLLGLLYQPDGSFFRYDYDTSGNLLDVNRPRDSVATIESYGGYHSFMWVSNPRWYASLGTDGGYVAFHVLPGSVNQGQIDAIQWVAVMNMTPNDGTGTQLQSAPTGAVQYNYASISTSPYPMISDSYGHGTVQYTDGLGRPTQHEDFGTSQWLTSWTYYDAQNNLIATVDPRGTASGVNQHTYQVDYEYDSNDNLIAAAGPPVTTSQGTFRPTTLVSYDLFNNVTASCDPVATHALGMDWGNSPPVVSDNLCSGTGATRASYAYPSYQPYGQTASGTTPATAAAPNGYTTTYSYSASQQNGTDYGLPTFILGAGIAQDSNRMPQKNIYYDPSGNIVCAGFGLGKWAFAYDSMNRMISRADPDDSSPAPPFSGCTRSGGQGAGWNTATTMTYNQDGTLATSQTPSQRAASVQSQYLYDYDRNPTSISTQYGCIVGQSCTTGFTKAWYDGADHLVEIAKPASANDSIPWLTRYLYAFNNGGNVTASGQSFNARGGLFDVQRLAPNNTWLDTELIAYDASDRVVTDYTFRPCAANGQSGPIYCNGTPVPTTYVYDGTPNYGFLTSTQDPVNETRQLAYNATGLLSGLQYFGDGGVTPAETYTYDAGGRVAQIVSSNLGTQSYVYDGAGNLITSTEPTSMGAVKSYSYYDDNTLKTLGASWGGLSTPNLFQYTYRGDGALNATTINYGGPTWTLSNSYTKAGRLTQMSDFSQTASRTLQYDTYGRPASYGIRAGSYSGMTYDAMGLLAGYTAYNGESVSRTHDPRGQLLSEAFSPNPIANGFETWPTFGIATAPEALLQNADEAYDARTGAVLAFGAQTFAYDAAGRLTSAPGANTFTYDAENRLVTGESDAVSIQEECGGGPAPGRQTLSSFRSVSSLTKYVYGPEGSVAQSLLNSPSPVTMNWHRDGDYLLFTDTNGSTPDTVYHGSEGFITWQDPTLLNLIDRNVDGLQTSSHNSTGNDAWSAPNVSRQPCVSASSIPASPGYTAPQHAFASPTYLSMGSIDDGYNTTDASGAIVVAAMLSHAVPGSVTVASGGATESSSRRRPLIIGNPPPQRIDCPVGSYASPMAGGGCVPDVHYDPGLANIPYLPPLPYIGGTHSKRPKPQPPALPFPHTFQGEGCLGVVIGSCINGKIDKCGRGYISPFTNVGIGKTWTPGGSFSAQIGYVGHPKGRGPTPDEIASVNSAGSWSVQGGFGPGGSAGGNVNTNPSAFGLDVEHYELTPLPPPLFTDPTPVNNINGGFVTGQAGAQVGYWFGPFGRSHC